MPEKMKTVFKAKANGRVNLIGEHTDYNGGWVLPTAIPQATTVELRVRTDETVVASSTMKTSDVISYTLGSEKQQDIWTDYLQGATKLLRDAGFKFSGFDLSVDSTVPTGSGLSSSAALEVAILKAMREAFGLKMTDEELAVFGQRIENEFVGARVGIMDQMACALATFGEALYLDTQTLKYEQVPIPLDQFDLIVINSGVTHKFTGQSGYNQRRSECEAACEILKLESLREANLRQIDQSLENDVLKRRARHVITENARVHAAVAALKAQDLKTLGRLFVESHASMRDDYEVSAKEVDRLVELCLEHESVYGARLTGGGFGGSIVGLVRKGLGLEVASKVVKSYNQEFEAQATILVPAPL